MRIASFNAHRLTLASRGSSAWEDRVTAVREICPDILCLQEILVSETSVRRAAWDGAAAKTVRAFAEDCGLSASVEVTAGNPHGTAMAANAHRPWFTAVLWNPDVVQAVGFRAYGAPDFWHGCTRVDFKILGTTLAIRVVSYHGHPISPDLRVSECLRLKSIFRDVGGPVPGFCLGDANSISAATVDDGVGGRRYYDHEPYTRQNHDDLEYQVWADTIGGAQLARRDNTAVLLRSDYMVDAAAYLGAKWEPTVGHWADGQGDPDPWGPRRIDLILATRTAAPLLTRYGVHRSPAGLRGADHLPPYVDVDPGKHPEPR
ncbi:endonuclease/exonuclease/phosphatase family protein [Streptomyces californicus]|uniref:endonuclease/exonuclease/phosphatase family protein n=1 Tax=Streptomyces californicus TaxID=67351 RepID=UPI003409D399